MKALLQLTLLTVLSLGVMTQMAYADSIDGNWCHTEGGNFEIRGSEILTPGGARMTGEYSRHTFRYVAPVGERAAGRTLNMAIIDDETLHLVIEESDGTVEVWRRCAVHTS